MASKTIVFIYLLAAAVDNALSALSTNKFPDYFQFGLATASYQVEGAWNQGNKSENIWDHVTHTNPTFVKESDNGDIACDSYHKYEDDVAMLYEIGANYYRFSLSWSRILPRGLADTEVNPVGIEYYRNLTQLLLDNGIEPLVTIFHWDTPETVEELGGWTNPEIVDHYAYYARTVFDQLGDLVKLWLTFNEPKQTCLQGYGTGIKAPGIKDSGVADYQCAHNLLKAHAQAYHIYQDDFKEEQGGRIGMVIDSDWFQPVSGRPEDLEASERALQFTYGWYANPIVFGNYPQVMIDRIDARSDQQGYSESRLPKFTDEEVDFLKGTYDFIALNHYSSSMVAAIEEPDIDEVSYNSDLGVDIWTDDSWEPAASSWLKVVPWGIRKILNWLKDTYDDPEIFITENGYSDFTGEINDTKRIDYFASYLSNVLDAVLEDGVNVTHYTAWSLMDNFEWEDGYTIKFGVFNVDFDDPERPRTKKQSADYYWMVIDTRCIVEACEEQ